MQLCSRFPSAPVALTLAALGLSGTGFAQGEAAPNDAKLWAGMQARNIGPAGMSGRVAAVVGHPGDSNTVYVGAATGGLWRSTDGGLTFEPLFDDQPFQSIGALAIHPVHTHQLWVGTGEGNPRNSASIGGGLFRSLDGGETFECIGLRQSERIHRIVLHPTDPDTAWVAAMGPTWSAGGERGVYKTTDGGKHWECVLAGNDTTGCADLALDPSNPSHLLACLWDHHRDPSFFRSGGPGSGLYQSFDAGATWHQLSSDDGLPSGELGRIGIAFAPSEPATVYAVVEAKKNVIAKSSDGGRTWSVTNRDLNIAPRPFYYARLAVDPLDPERVYNIHSNITLSIDGGRTFRPLVGWDQAHPDHHAMWIDPQDPKHLWIGNDGGAYESRDHGHGWRFVANLALAQPYHVRVDMDRPYHVYGGMQDNGSWRGPAYVLENGGIRNHHWHEVGFGDGFDTSPHPHDSMQGYAMSQEGYLIRYDLRTGSRERVRPIPDAPTAPRIEPTPLRFNWDAGFDQDPHDADTIWFGSQFVHRSTDRGQTWQTVSPDLTTNDPNGQRQADSGGLTPDVTGAENYTTITAIDVSPLDPDTVWIGTDDGRLHVSTDATGETPTWRSLEERLTGLPRGAWCHQVVADAHDPHGAFAIFDDHRRGSSTPLVFHTRDHGTSWRRVAAGGSRDDVRGYALALAQDPVAEDLWFLGTEFGLWVTLDAGQHWQHFTHGIPHAVSCMDLVIHPREHDLVLATHGRAFFVVDDIRPLREMALTRGGLQVATEAAGTTDREREILRIMRREGAAAPAAEHAALAGPPIHERAVHVFTPPPAERTIVRQTGASRFPGATEFRGENRPFGARISFWLSSEDLPLPEDFDAGTGPTATIRISSETEGVLAVWEQRVHRGVNRIVWNLRAGHTRRPGSSQERDPTDRPDGPQVLPGDYGVSVEYGSERAASMLRVLSDHRLNVAASDLRDRRQALLELAGAQGRLADALDRLDEARDEVEAMKTRHAEAALRLRAPIDAPRSSIMMMPDGSRYPTLNGVENPPALQWPADRDYARVLEVEVDGKGVSWYLHADGARSTTQMVRRSDTDRPQAVSSVAIPTDAGEFESFADRCDAVLERLGELERTLRRPRDVEGYTADTSASSKLSSASGPIASHSGAPTPAARTQLQRALEFSAAAIREADRYLAEALADLGGK